MRKLAENWQYRHHGDWVFGLGAEPSPLEPRGGGATEGEGQKLIYLCRNGVRPSLHHIVSGACGPRRRAALVMADGRPEFLQGRGGPEDNVQVLLKGLML